MLDLISASALAYEILLMRLFSIVQWHHFAYMVISLALLGYGASGTFLRVPPARKRRLSDGDLLRAGRQFLLFAAEKEKIQKCWIDEPIGHLESSEDETKGWVLKDQLLVLTWASAARAPRTTTFELDGTTAKITSNNQTSCSGCHNQPYGTPGGGTNFAKDSGRARQAPAAAGCSESPGLHSGSDVEGDREGLAELTLDAPREGFAGSPGDGLQRYVAEDDLGARPVFEHQEAFPADDQLHRDGFATHGPGLDPGHGRGREQRDGAREDDLGSVGVAHAQVVDAGPQRSRIEDQLLTGWFRRLREEHEPIAKAGDSIFIFRTPGP